MKKLNGFEKAQVMNGESTLLPEGGYVVKVLNCECVSGSKNGRDYEYLNFSFDVIEGEYKDHFKKAWQSATDENKRWKGEYHFFIPQENNQYYENELSRFKTVMANFEESNPGFHWDWDEKKLKDKIIGIIYRREEFETTEGNVAETTKPYGFRSIQTIRDGKFKVPAKKVLKTKGKSIFEGFETAENTGDLPF